MDEIEWRQLFFAWQKNKNLPGFLFAAGRRAGLRETNRCVKMESQRSTQKLIRIVTGEMGIRMYKKKLLVIGLCAVLAGASVSAGGANGSIGKAASPAEETMPDEAVVQAEEPAVTAEAPAETQVATEPPQTQAQETEPPQTQAPETQPPQTEPPQTEPPQTEPPQTEPPQTETQPATEPPQTETQPVTEPPQTETQPETEPPQTETQPETEPQTEEPTETETEPQTQEPTETETETESETDPETESEMESETSEFGTNEELIAHQQIVIPPDIVLEFRFTQVDKDYALISNKNGASVYEEKAETAREVGVLEYYGLCYILEDGADGWYYVESGNVRGFVKADDVTTGEAADRIVKVKGLDELPEARLTVARTENSAYTYTHTTVQEVLADKDYALAAQPLNIYEQRKDSARVTGTLEKDGLCYLLADKEKDWIFVESGDVRGFVKKSDLVTGSAAAQKVEAAGENNLSKADLQIEPEDNKSCYYTLTSVQKASQEAKTREAIVNFALQFVGNPYVWGGTSLTNGCDCSGFVMSVYANFGYSLPRVADAQSVYGMQIPVSSAQPGDLIFYARNGYVYHVSMYIGGGQVVHAAGRQYGIITSGISGNAVWATRLIGA